MSREKIIFEWDPTRLKLLLEKSGLSYDDAASKIGISKSALFKYCHGELNPSINPLIRMASYFNVPLDYLVGTYSETDYEPIRKHYDDYFRTIESLGLNSSLRKESFAFSRSGPTISFSS